MATVQYPENLRFLLLPLLYSPNSPLSHLLLPFFFFPGNNNEVIILLSLQIKLLGRFA